MSRADELKEKARQAAKRRAEEEKTQGGGGSTPTVPAGEKLQDHEVLAPAAPHVKPIRSTVDLAPVRHNQLKLWCAEAAVELGRSRVTTQDVMRVMVHRLLTDETLARKIRDDLRRGQQ